QLNAGLENRVEQRTIQLRQANKDLRAEIAERKDAEEKYMTLFERSKDGVFITTPEGRFIDLNPAGIELFGYANKDEILDVDISHEIYMHSEVREEFQRQIEKHGHVKDFQIKCRRKDGKVIDVLETATAVLDKDKNIIAYQGIMRDVTEKLELERELIQSQKMESIGLLAGGIAHDLNNVLTPVTMSIELLREKTSDSKTLGYLDSLETNANRGAGIVKQLLTFARRTESESSVLEPQSLILEVMDIVEHTFPKTIQSEAIIAPDLHTTSGDSTQFHQVLLNLCLNARDAMPDGGKILIKASNSVISSDQARRKISVEAGNYIEISVQDTGTGMPPKVLEKIFEPFFTTKQVGEGTGLGLSVIHSIIDSHGGFLDVQSQVGKGSTFSIFLPESED
ncbi:MAG: PAS domain S-box protein, partial [Candidatus Marinimicrobia bacterium]|nr:PAS domain S-box protein [Candidatus Neomarinimicrobiota bacterium]